MKDRVLTGLGAGVWLALLVLQVAIVLPGAGASLLLRRLRQWLYRAARPSLVEPGPAALLDHAAALPGLPPRSLGAVAVAQARLGRPVQARKTLALADAALARMSTLPRWLTWNDDAWPDFEARHLSDAHEDAARIALGQQPAFRRGPPQPRALNWLHLVGGSLDATVARLLGEGRLAEAAEQARQVPRDPVGAQPAATLARVAMATGRAGDAAGAAETLAEAVAVARRFSDVWPIGDSSGYRERALSALAVLQVVVGRLEEGRATMGLLRTEDAADGAAADAALVLAADGLWGDAAQFLLDIADHGRRAEAIVDAVDPRLSGGFLTAFPW